MTKKIRVSIDIDGPLDATVAALTDARQVTAWLAEEARIDLTDSVYELTGPSIPGVPEPGDGHMTLLGFDTGAQIHFRWYLFGEETAVKITCAPSEIGTRVSIEHTGITDENRGWTVAAFWSTVAENLRAWVERGVAGPRFDFRRLGPGDIEVAVDIDAPRGEVYRALTEPQMVERWMANGSATIEPEIGGVYDVGWQDDGPVRIVDLDPDRELSYSWRSRNFEYETLVTWELAESGGRTRLTLVHSGFAPDEAVNPFRTGWFDYLVQIKYLIERGDAWTRPEWEMVDVAEAAVVGVEA